MRAQRSTWRRHVVVGAFALTAALLPAASFAQVSGVIEAPGVTETVPDTAIEDTRAEVFPGLPNTGGGPARQVVPPILLPRTGAADADTTPYAALAVGGLLAAGLSLALRRRIAARRSEA